MIQDTELAVKTFCLVIIATASGVTGFNLAQWDLILGMIFKGLGCVSTILIITINWKTFFEIFKKIKPINNKKE
jgi:hypothetical protein